MGLIGQGRPRVIRLWIASTALMSFFQSPVAFALPAMEELDLTLRGEAKGWLNATCTYVGLGWLDKDQGRQAMTRLMQLISAHHLGQAEAIKAKEAALQRDPSCQAIWPDTPGDPIHGE